MKRAKQSPEEIAAFFDVTTSEIRALISRRNRDNRIFLRAIAKDLKNEGTSISDIAKELGKNESSVRLLLEDHVQSTEELGEPWTTEKVLAVVHKIE